MPDKRQESKQRRAARNRANREALAARRDNAVISAPPTPPTSSAKGRAASGRPGRASTNGATSAPSGPPPRGVMGMLQSSRIGDKAVLVAFGLAVLGAIVMLFVFKVAVDDRGEPIPVQSYGGLTVAAREALTGEPVADRSVSTLDAYGASVLLYAALPVAVAAFAVWGNRRPDRSRMLTFAMLAMAGAVVIGGGIAFYPALIALAIAGFRVRKADMPARAAARATAAGGRRGWGRARGGVIDADSSEVTDDDPTDAPPARSRRRRLGPAGDAGAAPAGDEDGDEAVGPDDAEVFDDATSTGDDEVDPLAELEAEIEAERAADGRSRDEDEPGGTGGP